MGFGISRELLLLTSIPLWFIIRFLYNRTSVGRRNKPSAGRELLLHLFFLYLICVFAVTLFPFYMYWENGKLVENEVSINIIPIFPTYNKIAYILRNTNLEGYAYMILFWIKNIGGNGILLLPMGFMLPVLWKPFGRFGRNVLFCFSFSLGIETVQLLTGFLGNRGRAFDVDDIIMNTIGAILGYILFIGYRRHFFQIRRDRPAN